MSKAYAIRLEPAFNPPPSQLAPIAVTAMPGDWPAARHFASRPGAIMRAIHVKKDLRPARRNWNATRQEFALLGAARPNSIEIALASYSRIRRYLVMRFDLEELAVKIDNHTREIIQQHNQSAKQAPFTEPQNLSEQLLDKLQARSHAEVRKLPALAKKVFGGHFSAGKSKTARHLTFNPLIAEVFVRLALLFYLRSLNQ